MCDRYYHFYVPLLIRFSKRNLVLQQLFHTMVDVPCFTLTGHDAVRSRLRFHTSIPRDSLFSRVDYGAFCAMDRGSAGVNQVRGSEGYQPRFNIFGAFV